MEAPDGLDPQSMLATPVREAGYSTLSAGDPGSFSVLLSADGQLTSYVLPDGSGGGGDASLVPLPRPSSSSLRPAAVDTLAALVGHVVPPTDPDDPDDPDDPLEPVAAPLHTGTASHLQPTSAPPQQAGVVSQPQSAADDDHCLLCDTRQLAGARLPLFNTGVRTSRSGRPLLGALEEAVEAALDPAAAHSQVICAACFDLTDRLDQLQDELRQARDAVRRLYWHTAALYPAPPPQPPQTQQQQQVPPQSQQQVKGQHGAESPPEPQKPKQPRRRPQRAATQHGPGHYRSMVDGLSESPPPQLPPPPPPQPQPQPQPQPLSQPPPPPVASDGPADSAPAHCNELDVDIHVEKASSKKRTAVVDDDRLTCRYCSKTFQRPARLRQHEAAHTQQGSNQCHLCSKTFSQKYYLREHIKQLHERRSLHSCDQCDKVFLRRLHLDDHVRTHSGERPYTCDVCGRGFSQRGNLRTHAMVHTDQFPFQCDTCGKRLRTRQALEAHQRKHNDDRRFSCTVCSASYLLKRSLERHLRKHTGDRPFKCSQCDRAFRDRGDLRCHEGIHSASRAHICPLCGQGFTRRYKMQMHLRSKHERTESQVQELCLLQQTAHTMLQQSQQKMEPMAVLDGDEGDPQQHTATDQTETQQLLVLASPTQQLAVD